eukprot:TRINITY_DN1655_c0_g1_i5.p1 TRINITY_DN1655_c0_g1~~TRINITY_DN1655_c0_g1_i5.p1  ORF type:complete len:736 (+),score=147.15 TRINITY_DN1655_c0_g1_i5:518-2725(+)
MSSLRVLLLSIFALIVLVSCTQSSNLVAHNRGDYLGWEEIVQSGNLDESILTTITFYLKHRDVEEMKEMVKAVSYPKSQSYGKYLSREEVAKFVSQPQDVIEKVLSWIYQKGVPQENVELLHTKDVIKVRNLTPSMIESMMSVPLVLYKHNTKHITLARSPYHYILPDEISQHVDLVRGVSDFPIISSRNRPSHYVNSKAKLVERDAEKMKTKASLPPPYISMAQGVDKSILVTFIPSCHNANVSFTLPPCSDFPPAVDLVQQLAVPFYNTDTDVFFQTSMPECFITEGTPVWCTLTLDVDNYLPLNYSLNLIYTDSSQSPLAQWGYAVVASPMQIPQTVKALYNIPEGYRVTNFSFTQSVAEFEQQYYSEDDLYLFFSEMGLPTDTIVDIVGPNLLPIGIEANLDIQYIMGIGVGVETVFWSIAANSTAEIDDILSWAVAISNTANPPIVNSLSYGMTEGNVDTYLGNGYLKRSDQEFMKLALMGITIIIADGDDGASDLGGPPMGTSTCKPLHADWPSQSPYVTSVGATMVTPFAEPICYLNTYEGGINCEHNPLGEIPTSMESGLFWTTGGGYSNTSTPLDFQVNISKTYLSKLQQIGAMPPAGYFNPNGRPYPDIATVGHNLYITYNGSWMPVDGTSASAPIFGGIVSLLNDIRLNANKPPLGFLNPLIYAIYNEYPEAYNDVVYGNNRCGGVGDFPECCPYGYTAVPGWDAITGVGTPNFEVLSRVILRY